MGKYKPETDSQGLCAAGATAGCVHYTCTDCPGDDPAFTLTPRRSLRSFTHAHTNTDTPTRTPALTPRLIPTPLIVAAGCQKGHYRTGCGGLQFPGDSSDTRIQHVQSHMASQCDLLHGQEPTTRRSPASPVYFNPGTITRAIASSSVRWATSKRTPGGARAGACLKWLSLWEGAQPPPRPLLRPGTARVSTR